MTQIFMQTIAHCKNLINLILNKAQCNKTETAEFHRKYHIMKYMGKTHSPAALYLELRLWLGIDARERECREEQEEKRCADDQAHTPRIAQPP